MTTLMQRDLIDALRRLRNARSIGDTRDAIVFEKRLNWLLDCMNHQKNQKPDYKNQKLD